MEPGQTGQQLRATAEEEVSQQQPHLCSLQHLQQEDHEHYPGGQQCGELLTIYQSIILEYYKQEHTYIYCGTPQPHLNIVPLPLSPCHRHVNHSTDPI